MNISPKLNHTRYVDSIKNFKGITVATGPAGTSKTYLACETCIRGVITGEKKKIIITRPAINADEDHGYLPGCIDQKMEPYLMPIYDSFKKAISVKELKKLQDNKNIEICPFAYMRGRTFEDAYIIADEMQNSTVSQMKMILTRLGENSKLIISGDVDQSDINETNGLTDLLRRIEILFDKCDESVIDMIKFSDEDIVRSDVVRKVLKFYELTDSF
jgi:phosphate starvation-inducible PhoH-like protein